MARIKIADLAKLDDLSSELKMGIFGGSYAATPQQQRAYYARMRRPSTFQRQPFLTSPMFIPYAPVRRPHWPGVYDWLPFGTRRI